MNQDPQESFSRGVFFICLSAVTYSLFTLFAKLGSQDISFLFLTFLRFLIPLILIMPVFLWKKSLSYLSLWKNAKDHLPRCAAVLVSQYSIFYYLSRGSLLDATVLVSTAPFFIPILEKILHGHKIGKSTLISIVIGFCGILLILQPDRGLFTFLSLIGILAGISQAFSQVLYAKSVKTEAADTSIFYLYFLGSLFSLIPFLVIDSSNLPTQFQLFANFGITSWIYLIALSLATIGNQLFRGAAYLHERASRLAPFLYIAIPFSGIFDWLIFDQAPNALDVIGTLLVVLGGMVKIYLRGKSKHV